MQLLIALELTVPIRFEFTPRRPSLRAQTSSQHAQLAGIWANEQWSHEGNGEKVI